MFLAAHEGLARRKHRQQWRNTLDNYVMLALGETTVAASAPAR